MNKYSNLPLNKNIPKINKITNKVDFEDMFLSRKLGFFEESKTIFHTDKNIGFIISTHYPYYSVIFPMNPEKINKNKDVNWVEIDRVGQHSSGLMWTGSRNEIMNFEIYLDSYIMNFEPDGLDKYIWKFKTLTLPHNFKTVNNRVIFVPNLISPPRCVFCWGLDKNENYREYDVYVKIKDLEESYGHNLETDKAKLSLELTLIDINYSMRNYYNYKDMIEYVYSTGTIRQPFRRL